MAKDYDNTDKGVLFKNSDKETDKHPDYQGQINVGGKKFWLSAWINTSKGGQKYMSLAVKPQDGPQGSPTRRKQDVDSDIPF